ncbi:MAG: hypothetical protein AB1486_09175 [Planctomycetota bacterium]
MKRLSLNALMVMGLAASSVFAQGREPGSLLVFPVFDNQTALATVVTVTNVNSDVSLNPDTGLAAGTIKAHFIYVNGLTCQETNRDELLTPNDTISVITAAHSAGSPLGYLYVYAKHPLQEMPVKFDWLIGTMMAVDGVNLFEYSMNAWSFKAAVGLAELANTDLDADGIRDFDGTEYAMVPDEMLYPRFFGQGGAVESELLLVDLTGTQFSSTLDLLIYNDNEYEFSAEYTFSCWSRKPLAEISGAFTQAFLASTDNDPDELVGLPALELGWFRIDGGMASSTTKSIEDPAFLTGLVERINQLGGAELPFHQGTQDNGDLLPRGVDGDP